MNKTTKKRNVVAIAVCLAVMAAVFAGCKKDGGINYATAIIGKWNLVDAARSITTAGNTATTQEAATHGEFFEFKKEGTVSMYMWNGTALENVSTASYSVKNDSVILAGGVGAWQIKNLTSGALTLYAEETTSGVKTQTWYNFIK
jgi:hypothetical protein